MRRVRGAVLGSTVVLVGVTAILWLGARETTEPPPDLEISSYPPVAPQQLRQRFPWVAFVPSPVLRAWPPTGREPFYWPFSATSPWNHPIGSGARYDSPDSPVTQAIRSQARGAVFNVVNWTIPVYRAEGPQRQIFLRNGGLVGTLAVPENADPSPPFLPGDCRAERSGHGTQPQADAHLNLLSGRFVFELYGVVQRCDGDLEVRYEPWRHDLTGSGIGSAPGDHTGSRAYGGSSLGGLIRKWELEAGQIRHALAAALPASSFRSGYVWPATSQDNHHSSAYAGAVAMGTLAALPPDFDIDSLDYVSPYGRVLARAMRDYGIYLVDSAGNQGMKFFGEPAIESLPQWEVIREDMARLVEHLLPVLNNGPNSIGGGGTPRAPMAPPLR